MSDAAGDVDIPAEFITFKYPLLHFAAALPGKDPPRIVAMIRKSVKRFSLATNA